MTNISPSDLSLDVSRHVSTAVLLLELSFISAQPFLQGGALFMELLRQRQGFFQVLFALSNLWRQRKGLWTIPRVPTCFSWNSSNLNFSVFCHFILLINIKSYHQFKADIYKVENGWVKIMEPEKKKSKDGRL